MPHEMATAAMDLLTDEQQAAIHEVSSILRKAELGFVMLLFGEGRQGAVAANIDPANAVWLIENALSAARAVAEAEDRGATLQ